MKQSIKRESLGESLHHVVLRIPANVALGSQRLNVVEAHNDVANRTGGVVVGKWGAVPKTAIKTVAAELRRGGKPNLFLVTKQEREFRVVKAALHWAGTPDLPKEYDARIPDYYRDLPDKPAAWFVVEGPFRPAGLVGLRLASNGRDLLSVISECRTTAMVVEQP